MDEHICQSCGMNMRTPEEYGVNADASPNTEYCTHCYQNGAFTRDITMDEMLENNLQFLDHWNKETGNNFTVEQARPLLRQFLSTLRRWQ